MTVLALRLQLQMTWLDCGSTSSRKIAYTTLFIHGTSSCGGFQSLHSIVSRILLWHGSGIGGGVKLKWVTQTETLYGAPWPGLHTPLTNVEPAICIAAACTRSK